MNLLPQEQRLHRAADLLTLIANPIRMRMIILLDHYGALKVSSLQAHLQIEQALTSHYLIKMKNKGLLTSRRQGKEVYYTLADPALMQIIALVSSRRP